MLSDACTMAIPSLGGAKHFIGFIDEASGHVDACPLRYKDDAAESLLCYLKWLERQTGNRVKCVFIDGGGEYEEAVTILADDGVDVITSAPYTSQGKGRAEKLHRTLHDAVLAMLSHTGLPAEFWAECLMAACGIRNFSATARRRSKRVRVLSP